MNDIPDFTISVSKDTRFFPTLVATLVFLITLLVYEELHDPFRQWFIPSLAAYVLGTAIIAYIQTMLNIRRGGKLSDKQFLGIVISHSVWLVLLILYNVSKSVL